ncbi:hypothetical protein ACFL1X_11835 [Candidatus Hydrogenedentota bacterium]
MERRQFLQIAASGATIGSLSGCSTLASLIPKREEEIRPMRTGVSCICHHNPKHIQMDLEEMKSLQLDDLFVCAQENDFVNFVGKVEYVPKMARNMGIRPILTIYGLLNLFGGGRTSHILLDFPEGFQVAKDGSHRAQGCYVDPVCVKRVKRLLDIGAANGFEGYYIDEPTPQRDCYCKSCRTKFGDIHGGDLAEADDDLVEEFRIRCLMDFMSETTTHWKELMPDTETMACIMPHDKGLWPVAAKIETLDNIGTNIYLCNRKKYDVEMMTPLVRELAEVCRAHGKRHHEWLQNCGVRAGREDRVVDQGDILIREQPDGLYVWAWHGQVGVAGERCENPELAWKKAAQVLRKAKG